MVINTIVSHYKILEKLGEGGMGVVYKAEDTKLKRTVALKFLPPDLTRDPEARQRFIREAQAASALQHNNVATIHEINETEDGQMFICMDCYEGEILKDKIQNGPLKLEEAIFISIQIAQGLEKAHKKEIVHRDIKPANIFITEDGVAKILDFGLAKLAVPTQLTKTGTTLGTVSYMSPEQAKGEKVDHRTDIWSLGVVLYEMLTGELPFKGEYEQAVMYSIVNEEPEPLKDLKKDISVELEKIINRALAKDKNSRYRSTEEILKNLLEYKSSFIFNDSQKTNFKQIIRYINKPKIVIPGLLILVILSLTLFWFLNRAANIQWAKEAVGHITELINSGDYVSAFQIAQKVEKYIPSDSMLLQLWPKISRKISIQTDPPGADVYIKEYKAIKNGWEYLGRTPIDSIRIPKGFFRWKINKEGFKIFESVGIGDIKTFHFNLDKEGSIAPGMVKVPGGKHSVFLLGIGYIDIQLGDYLIDKYEVTNRDFKIFVDDGGYKNPKYWKHPFLKGNTILTWEQAITEFQDATGRPGPATWELGSYQEGQAEYPVNGVNWYEAVAYAEYVGKKLPTYYHWRITAATDYSEYIIPYSNFGDEGIQPIGNYSGMNYYGTYDMAGNVREWCYNATGKKRFILGGAWDDPYYMFYIQDAKSPFDRSPSNGFRCVKLLSSESTSKIAERPITISVRDYSKEKPAPEKIYKIYTSLYSYDKTDLNPRIEFVDKRSNDWIKQKISYNAAYNNEQMSAYLFLPKNAQPPYHTVIIFPGAFAFRLPSSENGDNLSSWYAVDFVIKSGRAVFYPIYKSTYERHDDYKYWQANKDKSAYRDRVIFWSKDVSRSIDYLETRSDIDHEKLCFAGCSWGAIIAPMLIAMEKRIKVCYLFFGGFWLFKSPPEVDQLNFITRIKVPTLMINGRYDDLLPYETSQLPMYRLIGVSDQQKRHKLFDVGHSVPKPRNEYIKEVLDWLDRYLGAVE